MVFSVWCDQLFKPLLLMQIQTTNLREKKILHASRVLLITVSLPFHSFFCELSRFEKSVYFAHLLAFEPPFLDYTY